MFRFTSRDVLWLMVVIGLAIALALENRQRRILVERNRQLRIQADIHAKAIDYLIDKFRIEVEPKS